MDKLLGREIIKVSKVIVKNAGPYFQACNESLTAQQGRTLGFLAGHPQTTSYEIQQHFSLSKSSVSELLNSLVEEGYITYERSEGDSRRRDIVLTDLGLANVQKSEHAVYSFEERLMKGVSDEEIRSTLRVLNKIQSNLGGDENEQ